MIAANEAFLKIGNDNTKYVVGHGPLAKKSDVQEFHDMLVVARDRIEKLVKEGKSEADPVRGHRAVSDGLSSLLSGARVHLRRPGQGRKTAAEPGPIRRSRSSGHGCIARRRRA